MSHRRRFPNSLGTQRFSPVSRFLALGGGKGSSESTQTGKRDLKGVRPSIEWLEQRLVMSTFYVNSDWSTTPPPASAGALNATAFSNINGALTVAVSGDTIDIVSNTTPTSANGNVSGYYPESDSIRSGVSFVSVTETNPTGPTGSTFTAGGAVTVQMLTLSQGVTLQGVTDSGVTGNTIVVRRAGSTTGSGTRISDAVTLVTPGGTVDVYGPASGSSQGQYGNEPGGIAVINKSVTLVGMTADSSSPFPTTPTIQLTGGAELLGTSGGLTAATVNIDRAGSALGFGGTLLNDAVTLVAPSGVINLSGTFTEDLSLSKNSVLVQPLSNATATLIGATTVGSQITSGGTGSTITGLTIEPSPRNGTGTALTIKATGVKLTNDTFDAPGANELVMAASGTGATITGNTFSANQTGTNPYFQDATGTYSIPTLLAGNTFLRSVTVEHPASSGTYQPDIWANIQPVIASSAVVAGDTVHVGAGMYAEALTINKSVSLLGVNDGTTPIYNSSTTSQSLLVPLNNESQATTLITVAANGVTIGGLSLQGYNPNPNDPTTVQAGTTAGSGYVATAVATSGVVSGLTFRDNLVNDFSTVGLYLGINGNSNSTASSDNTIANNLIENIGYQTTSNSMTTDQGQGVLTANNFYAQIHNNDIENVEIGVVYYNYGQLNPDSNFAPQILNNKIGTRQVGITDNVSYGSSSNLTIQGNVIGVGTFAATGSWVGISLLSQLQTVTVTLSNNTINAAGVSASYSPIGYYAWNTSSPNVTITGGSVTNVQAGVYEANVSPYGTASATNLNISGVTITASVYGVALVDGTSSGTVSPIAATLVGNTIMTGRVTTSGQVAAGGTGVYVSGANSTATIGQAASAANSIESSANGIDFTSGGSGSVTNNTFGTSIDNNTDILVDTNAGSVTIGGTNSFTADQYYINDLSTESFDISGLGNTYSATNNFRIEDHIHDRVSTDLPVSTGLVTFVHNNIFVSNPLNGLTDNSIQRGIDATPTTATNVWTVNVEAGTYTVNSTGNVGGLDVTKPLTLLGAQAGVDARTRSGSGETILLPSVSDPNPNDAAEVVIVKVETSYVTIDGFTINGYNPSLASSGNSFNHANAGEGIAGFKGVGGITVQNNIIENTSDTGVDFDNRVNSTATSGNLITQNLIENLGGGGYGSGIGVVLYDNFYAVVTANTINDVKVGVQTGNYLQADPTNPSTSALISNNAISSYLRGIFYNLAYQSASPFTISGNTITAVNIPSGFSNPTNLWTGMLIGSLDGTANVNLSNNSIDGSGTTSYTTTAGYTFWNDTTNQTITINGGTVTGVGYGVWVNSFEGYNSVGGSSSVTVAGVGITARQVGVYVEDSPQNSNHPSVSASIGSSTTIAAPIGVEVSGAAASATIGSTSITTTGTGIEDLGGTLTIGSGDSVSGGTTGLLISGAATISGNTLNNLSLSGQSGDYITLASAALGGATPTELNAKGVSFGGTVYGALTPTAANLSTFYGVENKITDYLDNSTLGFVRIDGGFVFVTQASETSSPAAIQRGIIAASANDTVYVQSGTFVGNSTGNVGGLDVTKPLTLLGAQAGVDARTRSGSGETILLPSVSDPNPNDAAEVVIVKVETSYVTIDGFTINGYNPSLASSGNSFNHANAGEGIAGFKGVGGITVQNNIIENTSDTGVDFDNRVNSTATSGNLITQNLIENLGGGGYGSGIGVVLYDNFYAVVTANTINDVKVGVQTGNYLQADPTNPSTSALISNNAISSYLRGIFYNLAYQSASPFTISGNTITAVNIPSGFSNPTNLWTGMLIGSLDGTANVNLSNNSIDGSGTTSYTTTAGYTFWNDTTNQTITINGGTVTGVGYGVWVNSFEGYNSVGGSSSVTVAGVGITARQVGVYVEDSPQNSNHPSVSASIGSSTTIAAPIGVEVSGAAASASLASTAITSTATGIEDLGGTLTIGSGDSVSGGTTGLLISGAATISGNTLNNLSLSGQTSYITLTSGALLGQVLDATSASFGGVTGSATTDAQGWTIEDKITDALDNSTLGYVKLHTGYVFVTPTSGAAGAVARGVAVAITGDKVDLETGTYTEANVAVNAAITIEGIASSGVATINPSQTDSHNNSTFGGTYANNAFVLGASGVTIQNLTIDGTSASLGFRDAIVTAAGSNLGSISITGVTVADTYRRGIDLESTGHVTGLSVTSSTFSNIGTNVAATSGGYAVADIQGDITLSGNSISGSGGGFYTNYASSASNAPVASITGNTIGGVLYGMQLVGLGAGSVASANSITTAGLGGVGIIVQYAAGSVSISGNTISGSNGDDGVILYHDTVSGQVSVSGNTISSTNSTAGSSTQGIGIGLTDDGTPFGDVVAATYASLTGNSITGFVTGIDLNQDQATGGMVVSATLSGNTIGGATTGLLILDSSGGLASATLTGSTSITATTTGINVKGGSASIDGATVSTSSAGTGILVDGGKALIQNSKLAGNKVGLLIQNDGVVDAGSTTMTNFSGLGTSAGHNSLTGYTGANGNYAIDDLNLVASPGHNVNVAAQQNDFGPIANASAISTVIYDHAKDSTRTVVDYSNPIDVQTTAPTTVYVNAGYAGTAIGSTPTSDPNGGIYGVNDFSTIQQGLDAVAPGGTVYIANGTYQVANLTVSKPVSIIGASESGVIINPSQTDSHDDSTFGGTYANNAFILSASNVSISNLTIDGTSPALGFRDAIVTAAGSNLSNISISNVAVSDTYRRGIDLESTSHVNGLSVATSTFSNVGTNVKTTSGGYGVADVKGDITLTGNSISGSGGGFLVYGDGTSANAPVASITGNSISGALFGIHLVGAGDGTVVGGTLSGAGNTIGTGGLGGVGVIAQYDTGTVSIVDNSISGSAGDAGIVLYHDTDSTHAVVVTGNKLTSTGGTASGLGLGRGILLTDDLGVNGPAAGAVYASLTGNSLTGYVVGVELNQDFASGGQAVSATLSGNVITGGGSGIGVHVYDKAGATGTHLASVTITGTGASTNTVDPLTTGIDVDGGSANISGASIYGNSVGIKLENGGTAAITGVNFVAPAGSTGNTTDLLITSTAGLVAGSNSIGSLANDAFGATTNDIELETSQSLDATSGTTFAGFNSGAGNPANAADLANFYAAEDKIVDAIDVAGYGLVRLHTNDVFVTPNGFNGTNTIAGSIQRGINVASTTRVDNLYVEAGTYAGDLVVDRSINIIGGGSISGSTITAGSADGLRISASNVSISGFLINGTSSNNGIDIDSPPATISGVVLSNIDVTGAISGLAIDPGTYVSTLSLDKVTLEHGTSGLNVATTATVNGLTVTGSHFDNDTFGWYINANTSISNNQTGFTGIRVNATDGATTFSNDSIKGIYAEKANDAIFDGIQVVNSGTANSTLAEGVDFNLLYGNYTGITVENASFSGDATGTGTNTQSPGSGLAILARNDKSAGTSLAGVTLTAVTINGSPLDLSIGNNVSGVVMSGVQLEGNSSDVGLSFYGTAEALSIGNTAFQSGLKATILDVTSFGLDATAASFNNTLSGSTLSGGYTPGTSDPSIAANLATDFDIKDHILDGIDVPGFGLVRLHANDVFVTPSSFYPPLNTTTPSIQRGINLASTTSADNLYVEAGTYPGDLVVDRSINIIGGGSISGSTVTAGSADGFRISASNVSISGFLINGTQNNNGIDIDIPPSTISGVVLSNIDVTGAITGLAIDANSSVSTLSLTGVTLEHGTSGLNVATTATVSGLTVTGSHFDNDTFGWYVSADRNSTANQNAFTGISVTSSTFNNDLDKGLYAEKLNSASFTSIQANNSGTSNSFGYDEGVDLNLIGGTYTGISFTSSSFIGDGTGTAGTGAGLVILASTNVAGTTVNGVSLTGVTINGSPIDLEIGNAVSGVVMSGVQLQDDGSKTDLGLAYYGSVEPLNIGNTTFDANLYGSIADETSLGINATAATFNATLSGTTLSGGYTPGAATSPLASTDISQDFAIEDKIFDGIDATGFGLVRLHSGDVFVTPNSFYSPLSTTPDIQRGINLSSTTSTDSVYVEAGAYQSSGLTIDHSLKLIGSPNTVSGVAMPTLTPTSGSAGTNGLINVSASNVEIDTLIVSNAVAAGIVVGNVSNLTLNGDSVINSGNDGIDLGIVTTATLTNVSSTYNGQTGDSRYGRGLATTGTGASQVTGLTVSGGVYSDNFSAGLDLTGVYTNATSTFGAALINVTAESSGQTFNNRTGNGSGAVVNGNAVTVTGGLFENNYENGLSLTGGTNVTISGVTATGNGQLVGGSGLELLFVTNAAIVGGTFSNNGDGTADDDGASLDSDGIDAISMSGSLTITGTVTANGNSDAGIALKSGGLTSLQVGQAAGDSITLSGNLYAGLYAGNSLGANTTAPPAITANFSLGGAPGAVGALITGTNNSGSGSPTNVSLDHSSFAGYGPNDFAITLDTAVNNPPGSGDMIGTKDVSALNTTFDGVGFTAGNLPTEAQADKITAEIYDKSRNNSLGRVTLLTNTVIATPTTGLQPVLNAAANNNTVLIYAPPAGSPTGSYGETNSFGGKALQLVGIGSPTTNSIELQAGASLLSGTTGFLVPTVTVDTGANSLPAASINDGITLVAPSGTVNVKGPGPFAGTVTINKTLTLAGTGGASITATAGTDGIDVTGSSTSATISGFTINGGSGGTGISLGSGDNAKLTSNSASGFTTGVKVNGGVAYLANNTLSGNSSNGLYILNGAVVDAGQLSAVKANFTGFGISPGGNVFLGYTGNGSYAINNGNTGTVTIGGTTVDYTKQGTNDTTSPSAPAATPLLTTPHFDLLAQGNEFTTASGFGTSAGYQSATVDHAIEQLINGDANNTALGYVRFDVAKTDVTKPSASSISPLGNNQSSTTFNVNLSGTDPTSATNDPDEVVSGVGTFYLWSSTDGGTTWTKFNTVAAASPIAFTGSENTIYQFWGQAVDRAGNVQTYAPTVQATTYIQDLTAPVTQVNSVTNVKDNSDPRDYPNGIMTNRYTVNFSGSDTAGGTGLAQVDLYVVKNGGTPTLLQSYNPSNPSQYTGNTVYSNTYTFTAARDGASDTYVFFTRGTDYKQDYNGPGSQPAFSPDANPNVQAANTTSTSNNTINTNFAVPTLAGFVTNVNNGFSTSTSYAGSTNRSFIRYSIIEVNDPNLAALIVAHPNYLTINQYTLDGATLIRQVTPASVTMGKVLPDPNNQGGSIYTVQVDYGTAGIAGTPPTGVNPVLAAQTGDGIYKISINYDGSGTYTDNTVSFFRIVGDATGHTQVTSQDLYQVTSAGTQPYNFTNDMNGDGSINGADTTLVRDGQSTNPTTKQKEIATFNVTH